MGIINENLNQRTAADAVKEHKEAIQAFFRDTLDRFKQLGLRFWDNGEFTVFEMNAAYGTDAAELFTLSSHMQTMLEAVSGQPVAIVPPYWTVQANPDGTVTLTPPPPPPVEPTPDPEPADGE